MLGVPVQEETSGLTSDSGPDLSCFVGECTCS